MRCWRRRIDNLQPVHRRPFGAVFISDAMTKRKLEPRQRVYRTRRYADRWHFDKHLSINTLVSVVGMAVLVGGPVLVWGRAMEARVQSLEIMQSEKAKIEATRDADTREQRISLSSRLDKMDGTLSQLQVQVAQLVVQLNLQKPNPR